MPLSEKTRQMLESMTPERRANVMKLVAEKLTNEKLRRMQQQAEGSGRMSGAEPAPEDRGTVRPATEHRQVRERGDAGAGGVID